MEVLAVNSIENKDDEWKYPVKEVSYFAPASSRAVPAETARAEVNASYSWSQSMLPTSDGIYTIGSLSVKAKNSAEKLKLMGGWGFW